MSDATSSVGHEWYNEIETLPWHVEEKDAAYTYPRLHQERCQTSLPTSPKPQTVRCVHQIASAPPRSYPQCRYRSPPAWQENGQGTRQIGYPHGRLLVSNVRDTRNEDSRCAWPSDGV